MGANVKLTATSGVGYNIDVNHDTFTIAAGENVEVSVVDVDKADRHLLINVNRSEKNRRGTLITQKAKFLCGHDERDWFVAAIPETYSWVKNVREAKDALKPAAVHAAEKGIRGKAKNKRRNKARIRQGEWFFIPAPDLVLPANAIINKDEPISRGGGSKNHYIDEVYRTGGTTVWVCGKYPNGLTEGEHKRLLARDESARNLNWQVRTRDAVVYARGNVKHADHATIFLDGWHQVLMNTESGARSRSFMSFLD